jgi:hypothetical protein
MKKIFLALSLVVFVGTVGTTVYAANSETKTEITKHDDKKKKKKKSKKSCTADKAACSSKSADGTATKSCCSQKK